MHRGLPQLVCVGVFLLGSATAARQLGTPPASEWIKVLDSPERAARLKVDALVEALKLKRGDVVADLGAGSGLFTFPIARAVTAQGKLYAVEVDDGFLAHIRDSAGKQKLTQIETVRGSSVTPPFHRGTSMSPSSWTLSTTSTTGKTI